MSAFFEELKKYKVAKPEMSRAVDNILDDRYKANKNPFGISAQLEDSLDRSITFPNPLPITDDQSLEKAIKEVIEAHTVIKRPELHTEAKVESDSIKRVISLQTFNRWHLGNGVRTASYTGASDITEIPIENIITQIGESLKENVKVKGYLDIDLLQGATGSDKTKVAWWTWREDGKSYPGYGEQYAAELALSVSEIDKMKKAGLLVELNLAKEKHPEKLYRPTGLDSFVAETRFHPNNTSNECFGRTWPIPPVLPDSGHPEALSATIRYADCTKIEGEYHRAVVTLIYYREK